VSNPNHQKQGPSNIFSSSLVCGRTYEAARRQVCLKAADLIPKLSESILLDAIGRYAKNGAKKFELDKA
jgi:hypothetical protein